MGRGKGALSIRSHGRETRDDLKNKELGAGYVQTEVTGEVAKEESQAQTKRVIQRRATIAESYFSNL